ncbi:GntR family transcriptional regulator [Niallia sp. JL1B1071]|uniref:GntR family transcriptional regulator n=1 Tax=Niallia tiangongensis TaxID=3237105 RepID=UPI0037DC3FB8
MLTTKEVRVSSRDYSYNILKEKIMGLELEPGTKISEKEIADELNVSRTPVREAFLKLAQEELLDIIPQYGTIVSRINLEHVEEGRFIREMVEKEIVVLASENFPESFRFRLEGNIRMQELCMEQNNFQKIFELDEEFHQLLFAACRKERTWNMLQLLNSHFKRLRLLRLSSDTNWETIITQHKLLYKLILNKEGKKASEIMEKHLQLAVLEQHVLKEKYPHYFIG